VPAARVPVAWGGSSRGHGDSGGPISARSRLLRLAGRLLEVAVDRGAGDAKLVGDLLDGMRAAPIRAELVVHVLRDLAWRVVSLGF